MKKLVIVLIVGAVIFGVAIAGCDSTYALFLAVMFSPEIFQKDKRRKAVRNYARCK